MNAQKPDDKLPRFDPEKPVTKEVIEFLYHHVQLELKDLGGGNSYIYNTYNHLARGRKQIISYVKSFCEQEWPSHGNPALAQELLEKKIMGTLASETSITNTCFKYICEKLGPEVFPQKVFIHLHKEEKTCSFQWRELQPGRSPKSKHKNPPENVFGRIVVVNRLWDTEFTASFDRGIHSQADEFGIEIEDRRENRSFTDMKELYELNPSRDSVLVYYGNNNRLGSDLNTFIEKQNLHIVTTGGNNGLIKQDCGRIGSLLAEQCIVDEMTFLPNGTTSERVVLVVDFPNQDDAHEVRLRKLGIDAHFKYHNKLENLILSFVNVDCRPPYNERSDEIVAAVQKRIEDLGGDRVAAIFPRTEKGTLATLEMLTRRDDCQAIRVYGEWLASSHLAILRQEGSHLYASCCSDPYYFARYAVRAASYRWPGPSQKAMPVMPILINKVDAMRFSINSNARIPEYLNGQDVRLNGSIYAWADWMKSRCAAAYGPSRPK